MTRVSCLYLHHIPCALSLSATTCEEYLEENLEDQIPTASEGLFQREENDLEQSLQRVMYLRYQTPKMIDGLITDASMALSLQ